MDNTPTTILYALLFIVAIWIVIDFIFKPLINLFVSWWPHRKQLHIITFYCPASIWDNLKQEVKQRKKAGQKTSISKVISECIAGGRSRSGESKHDSRI